MPTKHLLISGNVQGVFYRATAREMAAKLGITGWVKNTAAGNVEAVITGTESATAAFISWCKQGPPKAKVQNVKITDVEDQVFPSFTIQR